MDPFFGEEQKSEASFDPVAILRMFWRRKWLFFVPFVLCLSMAVVAIRTMTPVYESVGEIRVVMEMTGSRIIQDESRSYRRPQDLDRATLANIWNITTSPKFLEQIVRVTGLYRGMAQAPAQRVETLLPEALTPEEMHSVGRAAGALRGRIRVRQSGDQLFEIGVRDIDPQQAFILSRVLLDHFLEEERATRLAPRTTTRDFLERQRVTYVRGLKAAEDSLAAFQRSILTETLAGNPINATNLTAVEVSLRTIRETFYSADVNEMARMEQQVRAILGRVPDTAGLLRDADIVRVQQELRDLEMNRVLGGTIATLAGDLGQARIRLNNLIDDRVEREYAQLGLMDRNRLVQYFFFVVFREARQNVLETLSRHVSNYRDFATRQPLQSARLAELQDEVINRRNLLDSIEREITQQTINLEASLAEVGYRIEVRRDPKLAVYPVEPDKLKLSFMGLILSLAIGFGLVILSILLDRSFTAVGDIERALQLSVIGTLPVIQDEHFKRKRRLRVLRWSLLVLLILGVAAVFLLYIYPRLS